MKIHRSPGRYGTWKLEATDEEIAALHWAAEDMNERYPKDRACVESLAPFAKEVEEAILPEALDALASNRLFA